MGYELPAACEKHAVLFPPVFDLLRPWFGRGITSEDLDACVPVATGPAERYTNGCVARVTLCGP